MSKRWERQSAAPGVLLEREKGIFVDWGATVPANGTLGYAPFALFFNTTSPNYATAWYINTGTFLSSLFLPLSLAALTPGAKIVTVTAARMVTSADMNKTLLLSLLAGFTSTLPAATGSGATYKFMIGIVNTSGSYIIKTAPSTDIFSGIVFTNDAGTTSSWATASNTNTITLNGGTTGGLDIGDVVDIQDIQAGVWQVLGYTNSNSTAATPFSHV